MTAEQLPLYILANRFETRYFQVGFQVAIVDHIECFGLIQIDQGPTGASFSPILLYNESQKVEVVDRPIHDDARLCIPN